MPLFHRMTWLLALPCVLASGWAHAQVTATTTYTATTLQGPWFDATSLPAVQQIGRAHV